MRTLTPRILGEILQHEGLAREAYRDSVGVWTWSVGITDASGHKIARYRDNPQSIERCLEVFVWLLETRYLPAVLAAFGAFEPEEHQLAGALSFHYNTGAIGRASWLKRFLAGDADAASKAILDWRRPPEILPRRRRERDLLFDAKWSGDGRVAVYEVAKPRYRPMRPRRMAVDEVLVGLLCCNDRRTPALPADEISDATSVCAKPARSWFDRLFWGPRESS